MNILVIDDHHLFADSLQFFLQTFMESVTLVNANDAEATYSLLDSGLLPDLILLDLDLPGTHGIVLLRELRERGLSSPVLIVSASQSAQDAVTAIENGAQGFISKCSSSDELLNAIDTIMLGSIYLPPNWKEILAAAQPAGQAPYDNLAGKLTSRQIEVIQLVSEGHANKNIADMLNLSENTIKVHLREVFKLLRVTNRTACVCVAKRLGYIT